MFETKSATTLRVARPTDHLADVVRFYRDGVGLTEIGSFRDHEGFDGVMLGVPGASYHFEFTQQRNHTAGGAPTQENLLVFYLPSRQEWQAAIDRMVAENYAPVAAYNPYWIAQGARSKIRMDIVSYSKTPPGVSMNKHWSARRLQCSGAPGVFKSRRSYGIR